MVFHRHFNSPIHKAKLVRKRNERKKKKNLQSINSALILLSTVRLFLPFFPGNCLVTFIRKAGEAVAIGVMQMAAVEPISGLPEPGGSWLFGGASQMTSDYFSYTSSSEFSRRFKIRDYLFGWSSLLLSAEGDGLSDLAYWLGLEEYLLHH